MSMHKVIKEMEYRLKNLTSLLEEVDAEITNLQEASIDDSEHKLQILQESKKNLQEAIDDIKMLLNIHGVQEVVEAQMKSAQWEKEIVEEESAEKKEELKTCYKKISEYASETCLLEDQLQNAEFDAQMDLIDSSLMELAADPLDYFYSPQSIDSIGEVPNTQKTMQIINKQLVAGNLDVAMNMCTKAIASLEENFGKDHLHIACLSLDLYKIYMEKGMRDKASYHLRNAQRIYEKTCRTNDPNASIFDYFSKLFRKAEEPSANTEQEVDMISLTPMAKKD